MICKCKTSNCDCNRSCICNPLYCRCSVCRHLRLAATNDDPTEGYATFPEAGMRLPVAVSRVRNEAQTHESEASGGDLLFEMEDINPSVESRRSPQSANPTSQASSAIGIENSPENTLVNPDYLGSTSTSLPEFGSCRNRIHPGSSFQSSPHATGAIYKNRSNELQTSSGSSSSVPPGESDLTATRNFPTATPPEPVTEPPSRAKDENAEEIKTGLDSKPTLDEQISKLIDYHSVDLSVRYPELFGESGIAYSADPTSDSSNIPSSFCENACAPPPTIRSKDLLSGFLSLDFLDFSEPRLEDLEKLTAHISLINLNESSSPEQRSCTPIDEDLEDSSSEPSNKSKASFLAGLVAAYITSQTIDDSATSGQHICTSKDKVLEDSSSEMSNSTTSPLAGVMCAYISSLGESSPEKSKNSNSSRLDGLISAYNSPRNVVESCRSEQGSCTSRGEDLEDSSSEKSKNSNASHLGELIAAYISSINIDKSFPSEQHVCTSKDEDLEDSSSEKCKDSKKPFKKPGTPE